MTIDEVVTDTDLLPDRMERVVAQRERLLSFLSAHVEYKAAAEDILQSAYLKAVEHGSISATARAGGVLISLLVRGNQREMAGNGGI